jgi:hypothetical protein
MRITPLGGFADKDALLGDGDEDEDYDSKGSAHSERGCLDLQFAGGQRAVVDAQDAGLREAFIGPTTAPR